MVRKRNVRRGSTAGGLGLRVASVTLAATIVLGFLLWPEPEARSGPSAATPTSASAEPAASPQRAEPVPVPAPDTTPEADRGPAVQADEPPPLIAAMREPPERLGLRVVATYPHDPEAYTQGLLWHDGHLYESTGLNGRSSVRRVEVESGRVVERTDLDASLFGEGLARIDDRLVQLTWKSGRALRYEIDDLREVEGWSYTGEGWGLCHDGEVLYMTDGSARLTVRSPEDFSVLDTRTITLNGRPQPAVNELECVDGKIYGNVYGSLAIVRIDPLTGRIDGIIDAGGLLAPDERRGIDVMNGIAYHPEDGVFYLTGKLWPKLFEVVFTPQAP